MGYDSHWTGHVGIAPPLTWAQIKTNTVRGLQDLRLVTDEDLQETSTGRMTVITSGGIVPRTASLYSGYEIQEELQSVVDAFPAHEFTGEITARPEDPDGTPWRYIIRDRKVIRQVPQTTWIDEKEQQ